MRLIDADALMMPINASWRDAGLHSEDYGKIKRWIKNAPTIEAEPVKHGWWQITEAYPHNVYCSECHKRFAQTSWAVWEDGSLPRAYCPYCGAKMDAEEGEGE